MNLAQHIKEHIALGYDLSAPKNVSAVFGNSIANLNKPTTLTLGNGRGSFAWMNRFLKQRFDVYGTPESPIAGYTGFSGYTSAQLLAEIGTILAMPIGYVFLQGLFENDVISATNITTAKNNGRAIIEPLLNKGMVVCINTPFPDYATDSSAKADVWYAMRDWTLELPTRYGNVHVSDAAQLFLDRSATYPVPQANINDAGGPHYREYAAYFYGKQMAVDFANVGADRIIFPVHYLSVANGGSTLASAINNPLLAGTGGTEHSPISAGNIPDGYDAYGISGTSGSIAKRARTDFTQMDWTDFTFTGPKGSYAWLVGTTVSLASVGLAAGDCVEGFFEMDDVNATIGAFANWQFELNCATEGSSFGSFVWSSGALTNIDNDFGLVEDPFVGGVLATRKFIIPATTTGLRPRIYAQSLGDGAGGDATFVAPFGRIAIRKIE